jgi:multidrug efflux pump subunit AcrA (membrane-fusion protein)
MRFILLTAGVSVVVLLGLLIDAQSRTPVNHPSGRSEPETIFAPGRIEGTTPEIELRPRLSGRIVEVLVEEGQTVRKGDVLLRLDDEQYGHEVALAAAELALAEAQLERLINGARSQQRAEAAALCQAKLAELERAELSWRRINDLRQARAVSQQEADDQRTLVASLRGEVAAAKARAELLDAPARPDEVQMDKARIDAANAQLQLAKVQWAEPAVVMVDTSRYHVRAFVEELDAPRLRVGMTARITADGLPGRELHGRVIRLSPRMSRKELFSDDPSERQDIKTREVWLELLPEGKLDFQKGESPELVVGLPVDVIIDAPSQTPLSTQPVKSEGSVPRTAPALELQPLARCAGVKP